MKTLKQHRTVDQTHSANTTLHPRRPAGRLRECAIIVATLLATLVLPFTATASTVIIEHTGATNPTTEGFTNDNPTVSTPVLNDLGSGFDAWHLEGSWCTGYVIHYLTTNELTQLNSAETWDFTATFRNLSPGSAVTCGPGPNTSGSYAIVAVNGRRFDLALHADGLGNQVLTLDPFAGTPQYTIPGLGMNYVTLSVRYNNSTSTADVYVNGTLVLQGLVGHTTFTGNFVLFGGDNGNFRSVKLQTNNRPVAKCKNVTVSAGCGSTAQASINNGSFDPDAGDTLTIVQTPRGPYPLGNTQVTLSVTDGKSAPVTCTATVTVVQNLFAKDGIVWHQPLARNGMSKDTDPSAGNTIKYRFKLGSTIPIKVQAQGCKGDVTANANVSGRVVVFGDTNCDGAADGNELLIDYNGVGEAGGVMDKIGGHLQYNLDTKKLPIKTLKCYILQVTLTDSSTGETVVKIVPLQIK